MRTGKTFLHFCAAILFLCGSAFCQNYYVCPSSQLPLCGKWTENTCQQKAADPAWVPQDHVNGCSSPITLPASFVPVCNVHDVCYGTCNSTQENCDAALGQGWVASCNGNEACIFVATSANAAVQIFGYSYWANAQNAACVCCQWR